MTAETTPAPVRVQRSRRKGAKLPPNTVCVTRGTRWGNPFRVGTHEYENGDFTLSRSGAVAAFKHYLKHEPEGRALARAAKKELRGKNLACFCPLDKVCHADVLLKVANAGALPAGAGEGVPKQEVHHDRA
jgi:hypothetical protein